MMGDEPDRGGASTSERLPKPPPNPKLEFGDDIAWALVEAAPDGIVCADEDGTILVANRQTEWLFGYSRDELLGRSVEELLPSRLRGAHRVHRTAYRVDPRTRPMGAGMQLVGRRSDGTEFPVEISLSPLEAGDDLLVIAVVRDIAERVAADVRLRDAEREVQILEDHERIARDLHDIVIQQLFASGMTLQGVWSRIHEPALAQRVAAVVDDLDRTIREIRSVIFGLQSREADGEARRSEILRIVSDEKAVLGFEPRVHFEGAVEAIPDDVGCELIPTLREALSNVARHAGARSVWVTVEVGDDVLLRVEDDGTGLPTGSAPGHGLTNMSERAARLGGEFDVSPRPGGGTVVEWRVPFGAGHGTAS
jgi:two-component system, NarL family, sensor histidine kinase DevS